MGANRIDFLKENFDVSNIPDVELYSFKKPIGNEEERRRDLEMTLKYFEENKHLYTTEL